MLHSSSGLTPFEIIYGKPPPTVLDYVAGTTNNEAAQSLLESRHALHSKLQQRLKKAQETMKHYADAKRDDVSFKVGQWIYVKLRPGRQSSVTGQPLPKLSKHFFGPFQIMERVGAVAYRLQLSPESRIHGRLGMNKATKILFEDAVHHLSLAIRLRMICSA